MTNQKSMYQTKYAYRCKWLKIFHHNIDVDIFHDENEAKYSLRDGKFSIIGLINDNYKIDGQFEFLLEYPDQTNKTGINRWAQKANPLIESEKKGQKVDGFEDITINWQNAVNSNSEKIPFNGLSRSTLTKLTLIEGTNTNSYWYFVIGAYSRYGSCLPGYSDYNKEVILWLRVKDMVSCKCQQKLFFSIFSSLMFVG